MFVPILMIRQWLFLLFLLSQIQKSHQQECYFHEGSVADQDIPCTGFAPEGAAVPCCPPGRSCLPNRMCSSTEGDGNPSRGSCTDRTWESDNCPQFCDGYPKGASISNCTTPPHNLASSDHHSLFCCIEDGDCCFNQSLLFEAENWLFTVSLSTTASSMSPTPSTTSTVQSIITITASLSANPIASSSSTGAHHSSTDHKSIGIGVGVGVAVPLLALAIAGTLLWRRRRRRHAHRSISSGSPPSTDSNPQSSIPIIERNRGISKPSAYSEDAEPRSAMYSEDLNRRPAEERPYELDSLRTPIELPGSEVDKEDPNSFKPRFLRPSTPDKTD